MSPRSGRCWSGRRPTLDQDAFERKLYVTRRIIEKAAGEDLAIPSFSSRTLVYKGMLTSPQLTRYFPDLRDERIASALALVHSRFSTNTFPSWELAHPYRLIAHNGEINTLRGNVNWMRARESQLHSDLFGDDLRKLMPVVRPGGSDSATFDNVLELLVLAGRSLPHALMLMIPEAWEGREDMPAELRDFYAYHSCLMEPWDGPAAVAFTDGRVIGATLDRNGLRPGRWQLTRDGFVVLASETGVLPATDPADVVAKGRLQPGKIFLVDVEGGRIVDDGTVKGEIAARRPYGRWYAERTVHLDDIPDVAPAELPGDPLLTRQLLFGYTQEDLRIPLADMGGTRAEEPTGSMGNDFALAVLSDRGPLLYSYFKQLFAQVTNPPIDPIREKIVMSVSTSVGPEGNLLDETPEHAHQLIISQPLLTTGELEKLRQVDHHVFRADTLDATWPVSEGPAGIQRALDRLCREASAAIDAGDNILILSDRQAGAERAPLPALLAVGAVHHHLVREGTRLQAGLVVESGEPREVHHIACLLGYGASAVCPYLAFETLFDMFDRGVLPGRERGRRGGAQHDQGRRQGPAEDDQQDGDLHRAQLLGRPDLRGRRARARPGGALLHGHHVADRGHRPRRARPGDPHAPRARVPPEREARLGGATARRRSARVAPRRRASPVEPGHDRERAGRRAPRRPRVLRALHRRGQRPVAQARHVARPAEAAHAGRSRSRSTRWSRRRRS